MAASPATWFYVIGMLSFHPDDSMSRQEIVESNKCMPCGGDVGVL